MRTQNKYGLFPRPLKYNFNCMAWKSKLYRNRNLKSYDYLNNLFNKRCTMITWRKSLWLLTTKVIQPNISTILKANLLGCFLAPDCESISVWVILFSKLLFFLVIIIIILNFILLSVSRFIRRQERDESLSVFFRPCQPRSIRHCWCLSGPGKNALLGRVWCGKNEDYPEIFYHIKTKCSCCFQSWISNHQR